MTTWSASVPPKTRDEQPGSTRDMRARVLLAPLSRVGLARFPPPRPLPARALFHCRTLCTAPPGASEPPKDARSAPRPEGAREDLSEAAQRARLLEAAMKLVPEKGWTVDALSSAAVGLGLSPAAHGILARGPVELVEHFVSGCDAALAKELQERHEELAELEIQNRLLLAMQSRLQMLEPHVDTWSQAGRDGRPARRPPRTPPSPHAALPARRPPPKAPALTSLRRRGRRWRCARCPPTCPARCSLRTRSPPPSSRRAAETRTPRWRRRWSTRT